jgi:type IV pilus assembly protein PilA
MLKNNKSRTVALMRSSSGFSLVELMVVVAIIGILASIAVPQFQKFTYKARLTEAKAGLVSLYTAEKAFYVEWSQYDARFGAIGYKPEGKYSFNIGFPAALAAGSSVSLNFQNGNNLNGTNAPGGAPADGSWLHTNINTRCVANTNQITATRTCTRTQTVPAALSNANITGAAALGVNNTVFVAAASATQQLNPDNVVTNMTINENKVILSTAN